VSIFVNTLVYVFVISDRKVGFTNEYGCEYASVIKAKTVRTQLKTMAGLFV